MGVGVEDRTKADVLTELALLLARLFAGWATGSGQFSTTVPRPGGPDRDGRAQALRIGHELQRDTGSVTTTTDLAGMLDAVAVPARRRALVVVISDFIGSGLEATAREARAPPRRGRAAHRRRGGRHPRRGTAGRRGRRDGEQVLVDASDPMFRAGIRSAVAARDAEVSDVLRQVAVPLHQVRTDQDLVDALVRLVAATRWRR